MPYCRASADHLIDTYDHNFKSVSSAFNLRLARSAFHRSLRFACVENYRAAKAASSSVLRVMDESFGLSCTAAIRTLEPKKGRHHCFVNIYSARVSREYSLVLDKTMQRSREDEDAIISLLCLKAIADHCIARDSSEY